jgi:hypothetical protein
VAVSDDELSAMAIEELDQACSLIWPELVKITPWGDTFTGIAPSGREVEVERRYLWAHEPEAPWPSRSRSATSAPAPAPRPGR